MHNLFKKIIRFIFNPLTGFVSYFLIVIFFVFIPSSGASVILFYFCLPFIIFLVILFNMSFISLLFRRFTMSEEIKRNHALEHGTIYILRNKYGKNVRIGGVAKRDGFRICGVNKQEDLRHAFDQLVKELKKENSKLIISMSCGTNVSTAQGFGIIILTVSFLSILILRPIPEAIFFILALNVILYFSLRRWLGNWIQKRLFMSLDFSEASIHSINKTKKEIFWERTPVYFVKTIVN